MDIEEIHVGERYTTSTGAAVVTGIDREKERIQVRALEEPATAMPLLGMLHGITSSNTHVLSPDEVYESLSEHD